MKIFILGSKGMLGRYLVKYLSQFHNIIEVNRNALDASKMTEEILMHKLQIQGVKLDDVIINCMGTIKPRVDELGALQAIQVNSVFPRILANVVANIGAHLIHPTTDCVYSGVKGMYSEIDAYDVSDVYGMSKALGEPANCTVIRTSIIGEEVGQKRSLVEWVKNSANKTVAGFTNHYWNGMTCLQFAKICNELITQKMYWEGIRHLFSNSVTKMELVQLISQEYDLNVTVEPKEASFICNRTLKSVYFLAESFGLPSLAQQIKQMKEFTNILYE